MKKLIPVFIGLILLIGVVFFFIYQSNQSPHPDSFQPKENTPIEENGTVNTSTQKLACYNYDYKKEECIAKENCTWNKNKSLCRSIRNKEADEKERSNETDKSTANKTKKIGCYQYDYKKEECLKHDCEWDEENSLCEESGKTNETSTETNTTTSNTSETTDETANETEDTVKTPCYNYDYNKEKCQEQEGCQWNEENSLCSRK